MTSESSQWSSPSLEETTVDDYEDDDYTCRSPMDQHGPWWERMEELAHTAEHDEILQESALLADLAEQNAREMQLALHETKIVMIADKPAVHDKPSLSGMSSSLTSTTENGEEDDDADDADDCASCCSRNIVPNVTFKIPLTEDDDGDDDDEASLVEAVEESCLQASFAERTALEMKQVITWWRDAVSPERPKTPSQNLCLPRNSLVVSSADDADAFFSPDLLYSPMITRWTKSDAFLPTAVAEDSPQAPRVLSNNNGNDQEHSLQVEATLEHVEEMKKMVHDLSKGAGVVDCTSHNDDNVASTTQVPHLDTTPDGVVLDFYFCWRIHVWLRFRHFLELWIWNCMPPDIQLAYVWMAQRPIVAMWMGRISIMLVTYLILIRLSTSSMTSTDNDMDYNTVLEHHTVPSSVSYAMLSRGECHNIVGEFASSEVIIL